MYDDNLTLLSLIQIICNVHDVTHPVQTARASAVRRTQKANYDHRGHRSPGGCSVDRRDARRVSRRHYHYRDPYLLMDKYVVCTNCALAAARVRKQRRVVCSGLAHTVPSVVLLELSRIRSWLPANLNGSNAAKFHLRLSESIKLSYHSD
jgi:hypothetical protein